MNASRVHGNSAWFLNFLETRLAQVVEDKCEKESPQHFLNVPDFWVGEVWKSRWIHSKNDFIGVLCRVQYVLRLTPLRNIGSVTSIIDGLDIALEILV